MDEKCSSCERDLFVQWCPVWNVYLCHDCKAKRVDVEIRKIVRAKLNGTGEVIVNGAAG